MPAVASKCFHCLMVEDYTIVEKVKTDLVEPLARQHMMGTVVETDNKAMEVVGELNIAE